jgi:hypothetical protein
MGHGHGTALARFLHAKGRRRIMKLRRADAPLGLCQTCEKAGRCTYPGRNDHVVLHCLEFEELSMAEQPPEPRAWHMTVGAGISAVQPTPHGGLCATCDLRATCTFPHGPEGSMFCEEYR